MMLDFVRDHVGLREVSGRAEALLQVAVEAQVDVDAVVIRAVERPDGRLREAASRPYRIAEQNELRLFVGLAVAVEQSVPGLFGVRQDHGYELAELVGGRGGILLRALLVDAHGGTAALVEKNARVDAEEHRE